MQDNLKWAPLNSMYSPLQQVLPTQWPILENAHIQGSHIVTTLPTKYRRAMARTDAELARNVVLALVVQEPRHGWALQEVLSPRGEIGQAWTLSKQLVYRAIDSLVENGLVRRAAPKDGGGGDRVVISPTAAGRRAAEVWLRAPVQHLRDVRTELVVKVMLREQSGLPIAPFIKDQRKQFQPLIDAIESIPATTPVHMWRRESASAVKRYLTRLEKYSK